MTTVGGRRRGGVSELDRVFSRSSASYMRVSLAMDFPIPFCWMGVEGSRTPISIEPVSSG